VAQSSSAERIVDVVEFLGSQPDHDFTLSELCRRLELSKATAHALLGTLTERGWVVRHPRDKTYRLGPALVTIAGAAGARQLEVVDYARDEMQELANDLGVQCVASAVLGDDIVLLAVAGSSRPLSVHVQAGQRIPLAPPLGTVFMAWAGPTRIDRWLRKLGPNATEAQLTSYRAAVDGVRRRGYSLSLEVDARELLERAMAEGDRPLSEVLEELGHQEYLLVDLQPHHSYRLSMLAAPVFGADASVQLALSLFDLPPAVAAEEVPMLGERLMRATAAVTKAIGGREPGASSDTRSRHERPEWRDGRGLGA
jgi:DNA-binding IclR family transcriptional regulator